MHERDWNLFHNLDLIFFIIFMLKVRPKEFKWLSHETQDFWFPRFRIIKLWNCGGWDIKRKRSGIYWLLMFCQVMICVMWTHLHITLIIKVFFFMMGIHVGSSSAEIWASNHQNCFSFIIFLLQSCN